MNPYRHVPPDQGHRETFAGWEFMGDAWEEPAPDYRADRLVVVLSTVALLLAVLVMVVRS